MSVVKGKVFRTSCCFIVKAHFCASNNFFVWSVIFWMKMTCLRLGIGAKVSVLASRLHPKNLISKAYANYTKTDKAEGLVVVSEGPKLIRREEKVVIVFRHPPKAELTEDFECWAIHRFAHVTEEGNQEDIFTTLNDGGSNNSGGVGVAQPNPNITRNPTQHNPEDAPTNEAVPTEVVHLFVAPKLTTYVASRSSDCQVGGRAMGVYVGGGEPVGTYRVVEGMGITNFTMVVPTVQSLREDGVVGGRLEKTTELACSAARSRIVSVSS